MATKVDTLTIPLPAGLSVGDVGPALEIDCFAHHACISAAGDFASASLDIEVSYDGEFWHPACTISGPGMYPLGEPSMLLRAKMMTAPAVGMQMSVRLVMGGAVEGY